MHSSPKKRTMETKSITQFCIYNDRRYRTLTNALRPFSRSHTRLPKIRTMENEVRLINRKASQLDTSYYRLLIRTYTPFVDFSFNLGYMSRKNLAAPPLCGLIGTTTILSKTKKTKVQKWPPKSGA